MGFRISSKIRQGFVLIFLCNASIGSYNSFAGKGTLDPSDSDAAGPGGEIQISPATSPVPPSGNDTKEHGGPSANPSSADEKKADTLPEAGTAGPSTELANQPPPSPPTGGGDKGAPPPPNIETLPRQVNQPPDLKSPLNKEIISEKHDESGPYLVKQTAGGPAVAVNADGSLHQGRNNFEERGSNNTTDPHSRGTPDSGSDREAKSKTASIGAISLVKMPSEIKTAKPGNQSSRYPSLVEDTLRDMDLSEKDLRLLTPAGAAGLLLQILSPASASALSRA